MSNGGRGESAARTVTYLHRGEFPETPVERLLEAAKRSGVVTDYDTGRGLMCWYNAHPGPAARALRDRIAAIVPQARFR